MADKFLRAGPFFPTAQDQRLRARADAAIAHTRWLVNQTRLVVAAVAACRANAGPTFDDPALRTDQRA